MNTLEQVSLLQPQDAISVRAAAFLGKRRFWDWNEEDQVELDAWLAESTAHRVAWLRVQEIVACTDRLAALDARERKEIAPRIGDKFRHRRFVLPLLLAASVAAAALWGGPFVASLMQPPDRTDSTDVGGRTLLSFADQSEIELNTNTAVRLRMTNKERTVWLEKGEAWFQVAHDAAHPFTVIVGTHRITDLGTEFLIRRDGDDVNVTLLQGRATLSTEGPQTATLNPGEEAIATPTALSVTRKSPQDIADELAWRRGELVFRYTRLADVVREFNRYNTVKLVIADPSIADLKIVANVKANDYESFLQLAEDVFRLRVAREGSIILISRGVRPESKDETKRTAHSKRSP